jgi:hypothetical protein
MLVCPHRTLPTATAKMGGRGIAQVGQRTNLNRASTSEEKRTETFQTCRRFCQRRFRLATWRPCSASSSIRPPALAFLLSACVATHDPLRIRQRHGALVRAYDVGWMARFVPAVPRDLPAIDGAERGEPGVVAVVPARAESGLARRRKAHWLCGLAHGCRARRRVTARVKLPAGAGLDTRIRAVVARGAKPVAKAVASGCACCL